MQKDPGKGESLLLAPGQRLIPWRLLLKAIDEVLMPHALERLGNLLDALAVSIYPTLPVALTACSRRVGTAEFND